MADSLVEPIDPNAAPAAPEAPEQAAQAPEQPQEAPPSGTLPDDLLQIPAMQGLIAGAPPAVSAPIKEFATKKEAKLIIDNQDLLQRAGMGFYRSLSGELGVIFNGLRIQPDVLTQADKAGKLLDVAPPFDKVNEQLSKAGIKHPSLTATAPTGAPSAPPPAPNMPVVAPPAPAQQSKLMNSRLKNLAPTAPTSGAAPGQGRLLNNILKPVI